MTSLVPHAKLPQRNHIHKSSLNIIFDNKTFIYSLNLLLPFLVPSYLKGHIIN